MPRLAQQQGYAKQFQDRIAELQLRLSNLERDIAGGRLDLEPHAPACASEEEHYGRHYAEVFPGGVADLPGQPELIPTLLDFADACRRSLDAEQDVPTMPLGLECE